MSRILMTTYGSYGDLNPYLGMARVLLRRGDEVTIATHGEYRDQVERVGAKFVAIKPGLEELGPQESWAAKANHSVFGTQFIIQTLIVPYLEASYHAIKAAAVGHDLIISHVLTFATPMVARELGIPWISTALQPSVFFSAYDPPALGFFTILPRLKILGPRFMRWFMQTLARPTEAWTAPVGELRARLGHPPSRQNVLINGFSPHGTLALFPRAFASPEPDWPVDVKQVGFPLFDEETTASISPGLQAFLAAGPPPVTFTLGTAVVKMETNYFEIAYQALKSLGLRGVLLVGKNPQRVPLAATNDPDVYVSAYEPFSGLFCHSAAIVHQCGVGTTSQALASGRPQVLVPFAHDQPDNARLVAKLGLGITVLSRRLTAARMTSALHRLLHRPEYADRAARFQTQMKSSTFPEALAAAVSHFLHSAAKRTEAAATSSGSTS